jgi:hypothetical protein
MLTPDRQKPSLLGNRLALLAAARHPAWHGPSAALTLPSRRQGEAIHGQAGAKQCACCSPKATLYGPARRGAKLSLPLVRHATSVAFSSMPPVSLATIQPTTSSQTSYTGSTTGSQNRHANPWPRSPRIQRLHPSPDYYQHAKIKTYEDAHSLPTRTHPSIILTSTTTHSFSNELPPLPFKTQQ